MLRPTGLAAIIRDAFQNALQDRVAYPNDGRSGGAGLMRISIHRQMVWPNNTNQINNATSG